MGGHKTSGHKTTSSSPGVTNKPNHHVVYPADLYSAAIDRSPLAPELIGDVPAERVRPKRGKEIHQV
uniref:DUF309 domain-containing protein n=1 Tax=Steinernema glaseri TaxID=37863 RepID=A0A1I8A014_9BILA